ncbi:uncharacterized protein [Montipora foliosa]|uniref:uncharacterized protein isoform X2 n=1 Tax=Montipora foliosa TaxID=591990 RepID=UPI0035F1C461
MSCGSSVQTRTPAPPEISSNNVNPLNASTSFQDGRTEGDLVEQFTDFPTPQLLKEANQKYAALQRPVPSDMTGKLLPYPNVTPKSAVFDARRFQNVDKFAVEIQATRYNVTLQEFTNFLTEPWKDDEMAKVRVILRWLAAQRPDELRKVKCKDKESTLAKLQNETDRDVFMEMCRYAGIQVQRITGYSKHARLEIGESPSLFHTWVALVINYKWWLVDPHWCCSYVTGAVESADWSLVAHDIAEEDVIYALNEDYFLTNPEEFIYSHLPRDNAWQLLARPVTLQEFIDMAYLKPPFFNLDLRPLEQKQCVLYAPEGEIEIKIGTSHNKSVEFRYQLWMSDARKIGNVKLERYCIMEQKDNTLICKIRFPVAGKFKHVLFGRSEDTEVDASTYFMLCAFIIHCNKPAEDAKALPENTRQEWGPGRDLAKAGIVPITHQDAVIEAEEGSAELRFKTTKSVDIIHSLHSETKSKEDLQANVVHFKEDDELVIRIQAPEDGDFALNLFSKDSQRGKSLCSYVICSKNTPPNIQGFATVSGGQIGVVGDNCLEIKLISHKSPIIECSQNGCERLLFRTSKPCKVLPKLELTTENGNVTKDDFVWPQYNDNNMEISFKINFPEPGRYVFKLYAMETAKDGDNLALTYICSMIVKSQKHGCVPFPTRCISWGRQCKLVEPFNGFIPAESIVRFDLDVPHADQVAAFGGDIGITRLTKSKFGTWNGDVKTGEGNHELQVKAGVKKGSSSTFTPLLKYQVKETEELKREKELRHERQEISRREEEAKQEMMMRQAEEAKNELQAASKSGDAKALRNVIRKVENSNVAFLLTKEIEEAKDLLQSIERIHALKEAVLKLDRKTMVELRKYSKPPKIVLHVMKATLVLLGHEITLVTTWPDCQKRLVTIGGRGLFRRVKTFDINSINRHISSQVLVLIGRYRREQVAFVSDVADVFYCWTIGMVQEFYNANSTVNTRG